MAKTYIQDGDVLNYINGGSAISSGDVVVINTSLGVALTDIAATTGVGAVAMEGVFELPAVSAAVIAVGEEVQWDVSASPPAFDDAAATPATGDVSGAAICWVASGNGDTTVQVKLLPGQGTVT